MSIFVSLTKLKTIYQPLYGLNRTGIDFQYICFKIVYLTYNAFIFVSIDSPETQKRKIDDKLNNDSYKNWKIFDIKNVT